MTVPCQIMDENEPPTYNMPQEINSQQEYQQCDQTINTNGCQYYLVNKIEDPN